MAEIIRLDDYRPHCAEELMCVACRHRWIGVWPAETPLKRLECAECGEVGTVIATGDPSVHNA